MDRKLIIAIDFDGTLTKEDTYPDIKEPNTELIEWLKKNRSSFQLILWTLRTMKNLQKAIEWCKSQGLEFDEVNDNLEDIKMQGCFSRKVFADYYIDDKSLGFKKENIIPELENLLKKNA